MSKKTDMDKCMGRKMPIVPLSVVPGKNINLSPGKHKQLIMQTIEEFGPRFTPGGIVLYVGDTGDAWAYFDKTSLDALGVNVHISGKMPDVAIHYPEKNWIFLIDTSSSHGSINAERRKELSEHFTPCNATVIYLTVYPTRADMACYLDEISWETEVWIADAPDHLIHFNGNKFFGTL